MPEVDEAYAEAYRALSVEVQGLRVLLQGARIESEHQEHVNGHLRGLARDWKLAFQRASDLLTAKSDELAQTQAALAKAETRLKQLERQTRRRSRP